MYFTVCIFPKLTQITKKSSWLSLPSVSSSGGGALETIAYYENQGILMTVQAAEDEGQKQTKGEHIIFISQIRTKYKTNGLHGVL